MKYTVTNGGGMTRSIKDKCQIVSMLNGFGTHNTVTTYNLRQPYKATTIDNVLDSYDLT